MHRGNDEQLVIDDTLPGQPREWTIVWVALFDRCDREADYAEARAHRRWTVAAYKGTHEGLRPRLSPLMVDGHIS